MDAITSGPCGASAGSRCTDRPNRFSQHAHLRAAVHQASFGSAKFTGDRWRAMAAGLPYADARCVVAFNTCGDAVAAATVWSAGIGKPGVLEPLGVHSAHRSHGYGQAIALAAAAVLQGLGASCAMVCTPSSNVGAVATYKAAGFDDLPARFDRTRDA